MTSNYLTNITIEIVQGDDYLAAIDRAVEINGYGVCWPDGIVGVSLSIWQPPCAVANAPAPVNVISASGTYVPASGPNPPKVLFDVPSGETISLVPGVRKYLFDARATLTGGELVTLARGFVTVLGRGNDPV